MKKKTQSNPEQQILHQEIAVLKATETEHKKDITLRDRLLNNVSYSLFAVDTEYRYTIFNKSHATVMKTLFDVDIELGKSILDYHTAPDDREKAKTNIDRALGGETLVIQDYSGDFNFDRKYFEITHIPIPGANGCTGVIVSVQDITDRKLTDATLKKMSRAVEQNPVSIVITDLSGTIEYANPKFCQLTGYSLDESIGQNPNILKSELTPSETYPQLWETILSGREWRGEFINRKKNGELYYELATISPILNEKGTAIHFVAVKEDITERKQVEEKLKSNQANLTALIENTSDDIWSVNTNYQVTTLNSNFQRNFQTAFSVPLNIGDNIIAILDGISVELKQVWKERYDRALQGERFIIVDHFEYKNVPQYVEAAFNPIRINERVTGVSIFSHDITQRKKIEKKLQENEERYRLIAENTGDVIWIYDLGLGKFTYVSPSSPSIRGYKAEETMTQTMQEVLTPESYQHVMEEMPKRLAAFKAGDKSEYIRTDNLDQKHRDGSIVNTELVTTLLADDKGNTFAILGVSRNITQRKQAEDALRKSNEELQAHVLKIEALHELLHEQATRDSLTTLYNRHYMQETLEREIKRARRKNRPIGIVMIDIDHFKNINDTYGHKAGDLVLQVLGELLKNNIRADDIPCRYGGDEILIVMPEATFNIVHERAELIRTKFEDLRIQYKDQELQATLSLGITVYQVSDQSDKEELLNCADKALYQAKQAGRNRVIVYKGKI